MPTLSIPNTIQAGTLADAAEVTANFSAISTWAAGSIGDDNFSSSAGDKLTMTKVNDTSSNAAAMQTTVDPYPAASESLATDLAGELHRIRYVIAQITGEAQWYIDPDTDIATLNALLTAPALHASTHQAGGTDLLAYLLQNIITGSAGTPVTQANIGTEPDDEIITYAVTWSGRSTTSRALFLCSVDWEVSANASGNAFTVDLRVSAGADITSVSKKTFSCGQASNSLFGHSFIWFYGTGLAASDATYDLYLDTMTATETITLSNAAGVLIDLGTE